METGFSQGRVFASPGLAGGGLVLESRTLEHSVSISLHFI